MRTTMQKLTTVGATLGVLLAAPGALAQGKGELGEQGQFILSADRLFALFDYAGYSEDQGTGGNVTKNTVSGNQTSLSFFYGASPTEPFIFNGAGGGPISSVASNLFFTVPRLGFDYVIVPNVTIGGNLVAYFTVGGSTSSEQDYQNGTTQTTKQDNPGLTLFGFEPRGGYILQLSDLFALWLRGGLSYYTASASWNNNNTTYSGSQHQFALDLEPQLVLTAIPHVGFTLGLDVDIPFGGGVSSSIQRGGTTQTTSNNASIYNIGLVLGMLAHF